jgi:uncharacterized protein YbjT (DUF2867 family)
VAFTSLRNGFYASSAAMLLGDTPNSGELAVPEDGPVDWTCHGDLAEATAAVLADGELDNETLYLTGAEAVDAAGIAAIASELTGRTIRRIVVPDGEHRDALVARGAPEPGADMLLGMFAASRHGDFTRVDPTLAGLLARPPTPLRDVLEEAISQGG